MGRWSLDDIPWDRFDARRVDPDIVALAKAAAVVEFNADDYVAYLCRVFAGDSRFVKAVQGWGAEEVKHGAALARWARLADPAFDFDAAFARFKQGFRLPLDAEESVRGSRSGELIARCMVEAGTSAYYTALADATDEPVLKAICRRIAGDEFAHYALFHRYLGRYQLSERLLFPARLKVALGRIREMGDDELAHAFHATNQAESPYDRAQAIRNYRSRAAPRYRKSHIRSMTGMVFTAVGLRPDGWLSDAVCWTITRFLRLRGAGAPA